MREKDRRGKQRNSIPGEGNSTAQALRRHDALLRNLRKDSVARDEHGNSQRDLAAHIWHLVWILSPHLCGQGLEVSQDLHGSWSCLWI